MKQYKKFKKVTKHDIINPIGAKMNRIPKNNFIYNKISFNGKNEEKKSMRNIIQNGINNLAQRAEREVVEYGDFAPVYESFKNTNPDLNIDKYQLKIFKMPRESVQDETKRYIMAEVYLPSRDNKLIY
jgi:hypothetical protein